MVSSNHAIVENMVRIDRRQDVINARLNDVQGRPPTESELRAMVGLQARADAVYRDLGMVGAPGPLGNESARSDRLRLLSPLQKYSDEWKKTSLHRINDAPTVDLIEREIYAAAKKTALDPTVTFRPGTLRERKVEDESGRTWTHWHGSPRTWMSHFMHPRMAVTSMFDPRTGAPLRSNR